MANFCGKCGHAIDQQTGQCPVCSRQTFRPEGAPYTQTEPIPEDTKKTDKKKGGAKVVIAVLLALIIAGGGGFSAFYFLGQNKTAPLSNEDKKIISITEGLDDYTVRNTTTALRIAGELFNIDYDENYELRMEDSHTVSQNTYYRMSRYYDGVPVYGENIIMATDSDGKPYVITSNTADVTVKQSKCADLDADKAEEIISEYFITEKDKEVAELQIKTPEEDDVCVYRKDSGECVYVYKLSISFRSEKGMEFYSVIYDAAENEVEEVSSVLSYAGASTEIASTDGNVKTTGWKDSKYMLFNDEYKISVFDFEKADIQTAISLPAEFDTIGYKVISSDTSSFDTVGVTALKNIKACCDYYYALGNVKFDKISIAINDGYDKGNNAGGGTDTEDTGLGVMLFGYNTGSDDLGIIGHEFNHMVLRNILKGHLSNKYPESGAINEGYADIFGVLFRAKETNSNPVWEMKHEGIVNRNIKKPSKTKNPTKITDKNKSGEDDSHGYSTAISHTAYLMWNGINGKKDKKISEDKLTELYFRSIRLMTREVTFYQHAKNIIIIADQMVKEGKLTAKQFDCVKEAFKKSGYDMKLLENSGINASEIPVAEKTGEVTTTAVAEEDDTTEEVTEKETEKETTTEEETVVTTTEPITVLTTAATTKAPETTTAKKQESAQDIYRKYLNDGKLSDYVDEYLEYGAGVSYYYIDMNYDGTDELLLKIDTGSSGVRGSEAFYYIFAIQNGKVKKIDESYYGGGSGGGEGIYVEYDSKNDKQVVVKDGDMRDGMWYTERNIKVLKYNGSTISEAEKLTMGSVVMESPDGLEFYGEMISEIKSETSLYEEKEGRCYYYKYNDAYVSEAVFDQRYNEITDHGSYSLRTGSWSEPAG